MTETGRGYFTDIDHDGNLHVSGWMLLPGHAFDEYRIELNGERLAVVPREDDPELDKAFALLPDTEASTFAFSVGCPQATLLTWCTLRVVARESGEDVADMDMLLRIDGVMQLPLPPDSLRVRISNEKDERFYRVSGLKSASEFYRVLGEHCDPDTHRDLLDWGCGCGRVATYFLKYMPEYSVHGCDVDAEAIAWCSENLTGGEFRAIALHPPTPYADNSFDIVLGYSVCTHLSRENQRTWLIELQRISRPGAILLLSVHGEFAAGFTPPDSGVVEEMRATGISDRWPDPALDEIAPAGYYLGVFQTQDYTRRVWAEHFEILAYMERATGNFQDLVVLRNRG
jgi:SAM-dependent methyltransferase